MIREPSTVFDADAHEAASERRWADFGPELYDAGDERDDLDRLDLADLDDLREYDAVAAETERERARR